MKRAIDAKFSPIMINKNITSNSVSNNDSSIGSHSKCALVSVGTSLLSENSTSQ